MTTPNPPFDGTEAGVVEAALAWWKHWRNTADMNNPSLFAYYNDPVTRRLVCAAADLQTVRESTCADCAFTVTPDEDPRNPATVHFQGTDGESLCGMPARDLDGQHHKAVNFYDGDATCERCNEAARAVLDGR